MKRAFTLVEFLVVLAIIAILAAMAINHFVTRTPGRPVPIQSANPTNAVLEAPKQSVGYDVQLLFMIDGMKVYRFYDNGRYIYVVDGRNSKTTWNDHQSMGKTVVAVPQEVQTVK